MNSRLVQQILIRLKDFRWTVKKVTLNCHPEPVEECYKLNALSCFDKLNMTISSCADFFNSPNSLIYSSGTNKKII